jgi:ribosome-associated protein
VYHQGRRRRLIRGQSNSVRKIPPSLADSAHSTEVDEPAAIPLPGEAPPEEPAAEETAPAWLTAVRAVDSRKGSDIRVLDLREVTSFADFFVIATGSNPRQIQAIAEEVQKRLRERGERPISVEGLNNAEWVLADYGDFIVHIFSPQSRQYYDLERLWRHAKDVAVPADHPEG